MPGMYAENGHPHVYVHPVDCSSARISPGPLSDTMSYKVQHESAAEGNKQAWHNTAAITAGSTLIRLIVKSFGCQQADHITAEHGIHDIAHRRSEGA